MRKARSGIVVIIAIIAGLLLALPVYIYFTAQGAPPAVSIPNPNAYDTYVQAGRQITGWPDDVDQADTEQLREFISSNQAALELLQEAAEQECAVPIDLDTPFDEMKPLFDEVGLAKQGQMLLRAAAVLAEREDRPMEAADYYLRMIKNGQRFPSGGVLLHYQMGRAFELLALRPLEALVPKLSPEQRLELADRLEALKSPPHDLVAIMDREAYMSRSQHGLLIQLTAMSGLRKAEMAKMNAEQAERQATYESLLNKLRKK